MEKTIHATFEKLVQNNFKLFFILILLISIFSLITAFIAEYIGYVPCHLCIYQRFPYVALILFTISGLILTDKHKLLMILVMLIELLSIMLSGYHSIIELGWINSLNTCSKGISYSNMSLIDMKQYLATSNTPDCSRPSILIIGLSIAQWNFIFNIFLFIISYQTFSKSNAKTIF